MLYSEFIEGTNCKDNEYNYGVYKNLEAMYMNTNMTKAEVYEYGKKLVNNSKSEKEIQFENEIKHEIELINQEINRAKDWLEYYNAMEDKNMVKYYKEEIKGFKNRIKELKWVLVD